MAVFCGYPLPSSTPTKETLQCESTTSSRPAAAALPRTAASVASTTTNHIS